MDMCIDMCICICIDMCIDMRIDMCVDMCKGMGIATCMAMCMDMCMDMRMDICTAAWEAARQIACSKASLVRGTHAHAHTLVHPCSTRTHECTDTAQKRAWTHGRMGARTDLPA